jgi:hypothetical protein
MIRQHDPKLFCAFMALAAAMAALPAAAQVSEVTRYQQHDTARVQPPVVRPAVASTQERAGRAPSDATVLFDGRDLSAWTGSGNAPAAWKVSDGWFEVTPGKGGINTKAAFGDVQLHIEWSSPSPPHGTSQDRGNSGVFFMGMYEVQILDSYGSRTYPDGQAASAYGQYPPTVNASLPPGQWQTYDIIFRRPRFAADGGVQSPAYLTVFHNGVLVQDHVELTGPTAHMTRPPYKRHADRLPIGLQDHEHPVRFRNVWVRDLEK